MTTKDDPSPPASLPPGETERALRQERGLYRDLVDTLPHGIYRLRVSRATLSDPGPFSLERPGAYSFDFASSRFVELLDLGGADLSANPNAVLGLVVAEDRPAFLAANSEAFERRSAFRWEGRMAIRGEVRWIRLESVPRDLEEGDVVWTGTVEDVTERRLAEAELRRHREHLEELVKERTGELERKQQLLDETARLAKVGGWEYDVRTDSLSWTNVVYEIHEVEPGFRPDLATGIGFYTPEAQPLVRRAVEAVLERGEPFDFETRLITAKGRTIWVRAIGSACLEDGVVVRIGGVFQDIDARKRVEEDLARHRARLEELVAERTSELETSRRSLLEAQAIAHLGSWEWDPARDELRGSAEFYELFGAPPESLRTQVQALALVHPDDRTGLREALDRALGPGADGRFEATFRIPRPSGRPSHLHARGVVSREEDGRVTGVLGTCHDVTELREAEEALRESQYQLARIVAEAPFPIGLYAEDGEILLVNRAWCRISGFAPEELRTVRQWVEKAFGADRENARPEIPSPFSPDPSIREGESAVRTKSGEKRFWDFSSAPVGLLRDGRRLVTTMAMDVTERRRAEEDLKAYREHLEEIVLARTAALEAANRELESFSYSVSHDLRAPLRALDGFSALLAQEYEPLLDEKGHDYIARIRAAARQMAKLVDGLLSLSRLSRQGLAVSPIDVSALARKVADGLLALEPEREVRVEVQDGLSAEADPELLRIALDNLVGNALKFTSKKPSARIEVGRTRRDGVTAFYVKDDGDGFDAAYASKLFVPFQRLHRPTEFPGTGIGLATVYRIIDRHGGRVWADSVPGAGATFYFTLGGGEA